MLVFLVAFGRWLGSRSPKVLKMCVVAVDQGIARPVGLPLDQVHLCVNDVVVKPLRGDEGLNVV